MNGAAAVDELLRYRRDRGTPVAPEAPSPEDGVSNAERIQKSRRLVLTCWAVAPAVIFFATFGVLCVQECTALPWLTFIFAPLVTAVLALLAGVVYWVRANGLPEEERRSARRLVLWSALWGPVVGFVGLGVAVMALQILFVLFAALV